MTAVPRHSGNHIQLLWLFVVLVALVTFLVDLAGWFHAGLLLVP